MESTEHHHFPARWRRRAVLALGAALLLLLIGTQPAQAEEYYICAGGETASQVADLTGV